MGKPVFSKNKVEQTIDLEKEFGVSFKGQKSLRRAIGEALIDHIQKRTARGDGMNFKSSAKGKPFNLNAVKYSPEYLKSAIAKKFGKKPQPVNMTLKGDMLDSMVVKNDSKADSVTIGFSGSLENKKAFNHCTADTLPLRPFFGISKDELSKVEKILPGDIKKSLKSLRKKQDGE